METPGTSTLPSVPQIDLTGPGKALENLFRIISPRGKLTKIYLVLLNAGPLEGTEDSKMNRA